MIPNFSEDFNIIYFKIYHILAWFLAFWIGFVEPHQGEDCAKNGGKHVNGYA